MTGNPIDGYDHEEALNLAAAAQAELRDLVADMTREGIVSFIAFGTVGWSHLGGPILGSPTVGVHLAVDTEDAGPHRDEILRRAAPMIDRGVRVSIFPRAKN